MSKDEYKVGMVVRLRLVPEWGLGKIVTVNGTTITVKFQNVGIKDLDSTVAPLEIVRGGAVASRNLHRESYEPAVETDVGYFAKPDRLYSLKHLRKKGLPPSSPGVYGWYFDEPPPYVPKNGCTHFKTGWWPFRTKWYLLYIGKASDLRFRVYDMHFNNKFWMNKSLSSLRLTLGCLLCKELNLYLRKNSNPQKDYTFGRKGGRKLSHWMAKHARVTWIETVDYVELEYKTINSYVLLLNTKDNPKPFDPLKNLKDKFTNIARSQKPKKKHFRKAYKEFVRECK